jgi:hypothetical protein
VAWNTIDSFSNDALLLKSADLISNCSEIVNDHREDGPIVLARFNAPMHMVLLHYLAAMDKVQARWSSNPLAQDLAALIVELKETEIKLLTMKQPTQCLYWESPEPAFENMYLQRQGFEFLGRGPLV